MKKNQNEFKQWNPKSGTILKEIDSKKSWQWNFVESISFRMVYMKN